MGRTSKNDSVKSSEKKKIPKQIKDQLNPLVQKLMNICSSVKVLTRQAEWEEIKRIFDLLKSVQEIEAKFELPHPDRISHLTNFYEWCLSNGAEFASVTVKEIKDGNLGVFAEQNIKEGEHFLVVPRKIMMSETTAEKSKLGPLISSDPILQNMPNVKVAMYLLMESLDPKSFWLPYISVLPKIYNTILYFNFDEIKELQGSPVLSEVFKILRSVVRQYCYFFQLFQKDSIASSLNIGPYFTYDLYRWAVSSVMTRQNVIPSADGQSQIISLIPLFDMCNHVNGKLSTDFNLEKDILISYSHQAYSQGQEVLMFYGPRTNGDFFVHNGFVYPENENDAFEIKLGISKNDPLYSLKNKLCAKVGISLTDPFYLFKKRNPKGSPCIFRSKCNEICDLSFLENPDLLKRAYLFLKDRIFLLLKSYKRTLEEDEEVLKQSIPESEHQYLIMMLHLCEKRILSHAYDICVNKIEEF